jgi:DNA-binding transcriptional MerR regulator
MPEVSAIGNDDRYVVVRALRRPKGFYDAKRASQLSGVPQSTINQWARSGTLTPDWNTLSPRGWSYRDLLYLRLFAWLRKRGMETSRASERVRIIREILALEDIDPTVRSDDQHAFLSNETIDRFSGQQAFDGMTPFLSIFDVAQPIDRVSRSAIWGPGLVYPSTHTHISPWVLSGEPCVARSRIPTSALFALRQERRLPAEKIRLLYPQIRVEAIRDAITLEMKLRLRESDAATAA